MRSRTFGAGSAAYVVTAEVGERLRGRKTEGVGVREPLVLGAERGVLAGLRVDRLDLLERGRERVDLAGALAGLGDQPGVLAGGVAPPVVELGDAVAQGGEGGPPKSSRTTRCASPCLSRHWSAWPCTATSICPSSASTDDRGGATADVGPRPPGRGDRAGDDELAVLVVGARLVGPDEGRVVRAAAARRPRRGPRTSRCGRGRSRRAHRAAGRGPRRPWSCRRRSHR